MDWVWLDQKLVPGSQAMVSGLEEGFLQGQGLFETMRCYAGKVFALERHLKRLVESSPVLDIKAPSRKLLEKAVLSVIRGNHLSDGVIRLSVSKHGGGTRLLCFSRGISLPIPSQYKNGFCAALFRDERIGMSVLNGVKSLNHYFYIRLSLRAKQKGFDEAFFLNGRAEVVEGSRTNIFLVKENKVLTPDLASGCLPGVTRAVVIGLLERSKIPVVEAKILPKELFSCDEIFVTNSLVGVIAVTRLDKRKVGAGLVGRVTKKIMAAYEKEVEKECFLG